MTVPLTDPSVHVDALGSSKGTPRHCSRFPSDSAALRMRSVDMLVDLGGSSCFRQPIRSFVHPFPPVGAVAATPSVALRFPTFISTMGSYDSSQSFVRGLWLPSTAN